MEIEQRRERFTPISDRPPHVLIVSGNAERLASLLRRRAVRDGVPSGLTAQAFPDADAVFGAAPPEEPDLVVLEIAALGPALDRLFAFARLAWPQTFFMAYTPDPALDVAPLLDAHGDMPVLRAPDLRALCAAVEHELGHLSRGLVSGLPLPSLLQMMDWDRKSVAVLVYGHATWGRLHLHRGDLVDAYIHDTRVTGEAAALRMLSWDAVTLSLQRSYHNRRHAIGRPLATLLMEAMKRKDETDRAETDRAETDRNGAETDGSPEKFDGLDMAALLIDEGGEPDTPEEREREARRMANVKATMDAALEIDGALGAALVDSSSGMALGMIGGGVNLEMAAAGNTEVVRAKLRTMQTLGISGTIEDILITLQAQYHIIYLIPDTTLFLYLVLAKDRANLAMGRFKLKALAGEIKL